MHEINKKAKDICDLKESLLCQVKPYVDRGAFCETVDGHAVGLVIDMIKDLCEAEKDLYKACYYKEVVTAMKNADENKECWSKVLAMVGMMNLLGEESEQSDRMGYDNWRYASGRFAPTGRGHYAGYTDPKIGNRVADNKRMDENEMRVGNMSGYPHPSMRGSYRASGKYGYPMDEDKSKSYNDYMDAKKYYHESKDPEAKKDMEQHAKTHLMDSLESVEDMWDDAKPETKKEFRENMMKFLKDVPVN